MESHLAPESCFVCGRPKNEHIGDNSHSFWSNAQAKKEFKKEPLSDAFVEAQYVETYRPY